MRSVKYRVKNPETGNSEWMNENELSSYLEDDKNKEELTVEKIKSDTIREKKFTYFSTAVVLIFLSVFVFVGIMVLLGGINDKTVLSTIMGIAMIVSPGSIGWYIIKKCKKFSKQSNSIKNDNFRIFEDEIYDKYYTTSTDNDGDKTYYYYVVSKTYGAVSVNPFYYNFSFKGDRIYLIISGDKTDKNYLSDEKILKHGIADAEERRNKDVIGGKYLAKLVTLSTDTRSRLVLFDENNAEYKLSKRTDDTIKRMVENGEKKRCKNCGKKYAFKKYDTCPKCGEHNCFDFTDTIHCKEWYA